jgi:hypothetical protein
MGYSPCPIAGAGAGRCRMIQAQMIVLVSEIPEFRDLKTWITNVRDLGGTCP